MAKRNTSTILHKEPTCLIKTNVQFKSELQQRIELGEDILKKNIQDLKDFEELKTEYLSWHDYNIELLKQSFNEPNNEYRKQYEEVGSWSGIFLNTSCTPAQDLKDFIDKFNSKVENLKNLVRKIELLKSSKIHIQNEKTIDLNVEKSEVFIVHGHDDLAKTETARFIEQLGFKPIILHEQANAGKTIIEKIESYSNIGFGIVLYTPCDIGAEKGHETDFNYRARQNVVFEHGFLIGKIGRENVAAIVKGDIETPNDISGVVYILMEKDWKLELAKELRNSGYHVDMNKVI